MRAIKSITICFIAAICVNPDSKAEIFKRSLEHTFAASVVLSDSDAFTFGINDFNPNGILNIENDEIGSAESVELRQTINVLAIPYSYTWGEKQESYHSADFKISWINVEQKVDFSSFEPSLNSDDFKEDVYGGYGGYHYHNQIDEHWYANYGVGGHLLYYVNSYDYNNDASNQYQNYLDGVIYNTNAWAFLVEPSVKIGYKHVEDWGNWQYSSRLNYLLGKGWGEANSGDVGTPETTRWINQIQIYRELTHWEGMVQSAFASFKRVDLRGDSTQPLNTTYYYELMGGWLITPPFETVLIDNIGIGLSFNYGSALKGGSIVLYFNQQ